MKKNELKLVLLVVIFEVLYFVWQGKDLYSLFTGENGPFFIMFYVGLGCIPFLYMTVLIIPFFIHKRKMTRQLAYQKKSIRLEKRLERISQDEIKDIISKDFGVSKESLEFALFEETGDSSYLVSGSLRV